MCSVIGYVGKNLSKTYVVQGLTRLEYRGYDSAGFACIDSHNKRLWYRKVEGHVERLIEVLAYQGTDGHVAIGHTRWATHGVVSEQNAHPQIDCKKKISVVHNGIIENYAELKSALEKQGHSFQSQTDTEIIAHFFEDIFQNVSLFQESLVAVLNRLRGAYAFVIIAEQYPDALIVVRKGSPLCIGIGTEEILVASDIFAFTGLVQKVVFMPDESFAIIKENSVELYDFQANRIEFTPQEIPVTSLDYDKQGYEHYMLKEIFEQKKAIYATISNYKKYTVSALLRSWGLTEEIIKNIASITLIGCGSSWHAARIAQFYFEQVLSIPAHVVLASEFRYMPIFNSRDTLYIAVSQSGETADTLEVVRLLRGIKATVIALTNVASSSIARESSGSILTHAGQEISVATTKAFSAQLASLYLVAHFIGHEKGIIDDTSLSKAYDELIMAAEVLENTIDKYNAFIVSHLAKRYAYFEKFIFLGRSISYPFAMEAALKLKEISYIFAQCYPAGELKHGAIALVAKDVPVILCSTLDDVIYQKLLSNAQEVKARGGHLVVFAFEGQEELCLLADLVFIIPRVNPLLGPLAMTGVMQFFVYHIAKQLGCPIDKPRNLAKSVTVE